MSDEELMRFYAANDDLRVERDANGEILVTTPAGNRTGKMDAAIIIALGIWAERDGRGYAFDSNTGFTLPDNSMHSPDAAWVREARWDALDTQDQDRFSHVCPEFIVELRSPSDNLGRAAGEDGAVDCEGVQVAWLVDPIERNVFIYRPGDSSEV